MQDTPKETTSNVRKTTLAKLGPTLPIGIYGSDGKLHRDLRHSKWVLKHDKLISRLRREYQAANQFMWASVVVAAMYEQIGHHNMSDMKLEQKLAIISGMFFGDVMYAYMWLGRNTIGGNILLNLPCNRCFKIIEKFPADLDTLEVMVCSDPTIERWSHDLNEPLTMGEMKIHSLELGPPMWSPLETAGDEEGLSEAETKAALIQGALQPVDGMQVTEEMLDEGLTKPDFEDLVTGINDNHIGPNLKVEDNCPLCKRDFVSAIDWSYDSFFGASSRS